MEITPRILCLLVGYLLGSFLTAECIARRLTGRSARDLGSGNPGMANIMATLGKGPGFAVLAGDVHRGPAVGEQPGRPDLPVAHCPVQRGHADPVLPVDLRPTVEQLQTSALTLIEAMIDPAAVGGAS